MNKRSYLPYFLFAICLMLLMTIPQDIADHWRHASVKLYAPTWQSLHIVKCDLFTFLKINPATLDTKRENTEIADLELENHLLKEQIELLKSYVFQKEQLDMEYKILSEWHHKEQQEENDFWRAFLHRRKQDAFNILQLHMQSVKASVVFRDPTSWNSSLWINVGEKNNRQLGKTVIAKNSPVVSGRSLIGIVESVGKSYSRVRLITDSGLVPSVRAIRGIEQDDLIINHLNMAITQLQLRQDLEKEFKKDLVHNLYVIKEALPKESYTEYMAKGELHGMSAPIWRRSSHVLKGIGFNYDIADSEGPARHLRTGEPLDHHEALYPSALIKLGDLLVTTGMDGIFPPGLHVAIVNKILPLKEGGCSYELEASVVADLENLKEIFVLPACGIDEKVILELK